MTGKVLQVWMASDWHPRTRNKDIFKNRETTNIRARCLNSLVLVRRSQVQVPIQSNCLRSTQKCTMKEFTYHSFKPDQHILLWHYVTSVTKYSFKNDWVGQIGDNIWGSFNISCLPWPCRHGDPDKMMEVLMCDVDKNDEKELRRFMRSQQLLWHPDKFMQKCGSRLVEGDRVKILERVTKLSQALNRLSEGDKGRWLTTFLSSEVSWLRPLWSVLIHSVMLADRPAIKKNYLSLSDQHIMENIAFMS